jgi:hypothetical protein
VTHKLLCDGTITSDDKELRLSIDADQQHSLQVWTHLVAKP